MTNFVPAFPVLGAIIGLVVYFPFLCMSVEYRTDVEHYYDKVITVKRAMQPIIRGENVQRTTDKSIKCEPYVIEEPKMDNERIVIRKMVERKSGRGNPVIRTIGTIPVYKKNYRITCNFDSGPPKLDPPRLHPPKLDPPKLHPPKLDLPKLYPPKIYPPRLGPRMSVEEIDRQVVGYITKTELVFEKPFKPLDISYAASLLGSTLLLGQMVVRAKFRRPKNKFR